MIRLVLAAALAVLAACQPVPEEQLGPDGLPLPKVYRLTEQDTARVQYRMLDAVNSLRGAAGRSRLELNSELNASAATHARDLSIQNRPWHFGSDLSSPLERAERVGYDKLALGEAISESFESEVETLAAWMQKDITRFVVLDPRATEMGFAWFQEQNGKLWWVMTTGGPFPVLEEAEG